MKRIPLILAVLFTLVFISRSVSMAIAAYSVNFRFAWPTEAIAITVGCFVVATFSWAWVALRHHQGSAA